MSRGNQQCDFTHCYLTDVEFKLLRHRWQDMKGCIDAVVVPSNVYSHMDNGEGINTNAGLMMEYLLILSILYTPEKYYNLTMEYCKCRRGLCVIDMRALYMLTTSWFMSVEKGMTEIYLQHFPYFITIRGIRDYDNIAEIVENKRTESLMGVDFPYCAPVYLMYSDSTIVQYTNDMVEDIVGGITKQVGTDSLLVPMFDRGIMGNVTTLISRFSDTTSCHVSQEGPEDKFCTGWKERVMSLPFYRFRNVVYRLECADFISVHNGIFDHPVICLSYSRSKWYLPVYEQMSMVSLGVDYSRKLALPTVRYCMLSAVFNSEIRPIWLDILKREYARLLLLPPPGQAEFKIKESQMEQVDDFLIVYYNIMTKRANLPVQSSWKGISLKGFSSMLTLTKKRVKIRSTGELLMNSDQPLSFRYVTDVTASKSRIRKPPCAPALKISRQLDLYRPDTVCVLPSGSGMFCLAPNTDGSVSVIKSDNNDIVVPYEWAKNTQVACERVMARKRNLAKKEMKYGKVPDGIVVYRTDIKMVVMGNGVEMALLEDIKRDRARHARLEYRRKQLEHIYHMVHNTPTLVPVGLRVEYLYRGKSGRCMVVDVVGDGKVMAPYSCVFKSKKEEGKKAKSIRKDYNDSLRPYIDKIDGMVRRSKVVKEAPIRKPCVSVYSNPYTPMTDIKREEDINGMYRTYIESEEKPKHVVQHSFALKDGLRKPSSLRPIVASMDKGTLPEDALVAENWSLVGKVNDSSSIDHIYIPGSRIHVRKDSMYYNRMLCSARRPFKRDADGDVIDITDTKIFQLQDYTNYVPFSEPRRGDRLYLDKIMEKSSSTCDPS